MPSPPEVRANDEIDALSIPRYHCFILPLVRPREEMTPVRETRIGMGDCIGQGQPPAGGEASLRGLTADPSTVDGFRWTRREARAVSS